MYSNLYTIKRSSITINYWSRSKLLTLVAYLVSVFVSGHTIHAQSPTDYLFEGAQKYDPDLYKYTLGTPYLYSDWVIGKVFNSNGEIYHPLLINFNAKENVWEARHNNKIISLDPNYFWCVQIFREENNFIDSTLVDVQLFVRGILPEDEMKYGQILYNGVRLKLIKAFEVASTSTGISTNSYNSTSINKLKFNIFKHIHYYYLNIDHNHVKTNLSIKDIYSKLDEKKGIKKLLEELNPSTEIEWIDAMVQVEEQFF